MSTLPSDLYTHLEQLDRDNPVESADYREQAQEILANPNIALKIRTAIADLLLQANQQLTLKTVGGEDSY
jgi:hypothetical protein